MLKRNLIAAIILFASSAPALAHLSPEEHGSFMAGITHPLFGLDHILVMVAVGLWAAYIGGRAIWMVPAAFVASMALGFVAALIGLPLPLVEPVILASIVFVGIMIALALPVSPVAVAAMVAFFAFFHGHAHGDEIGSAGVLGYASGFIISTALLHAAGIALGIAFAKLTQKSATLTRITGALTALGGAYIAIAG